MCKKISKRKSFSIRIEKDLLEKLKVISQYEGRSVNSQLNILIRICIANFEAQHICPTAHSDK